MSLFKVETSKTIQTIEEFLNKTKKGRRKKIMTIDKYDRNELITEAIKIINHTIAYTNDPDIDYVDIRLQLVDGHYEFHVGDSQYDVDHRGSWGYISVLTYDEGCEDIQVLAAELVDEALDDYYGFIDEPSDFGLCGVYVDFN